MADNLIQSSNISVSFNNRKVIANVSLNVAAKEIVTIIGPNGSGKTTLLRAICGLQKIDSGDINLKPGIVIGYMPQKLVIDKVLPLTVRRFLRLTGKERKLRDINSVEKIAEEQGIKHILTQQIHDISGGEMQRVMLTRALLMNPDILVMDEPTQGLDINGQADFYKMVADIRNKKGCAVLMVSHDLNMVMASTDRVICMNQHVCCEGKPSDVGAHPEYLALFGREAAENVAIYTHHHDHTHEIDGHVCGEKDV